jgi:hypothetical protein
LYNLVALAVEKGSRSRMRMGVGKRIWGVKKRPRGRPRKLEDSMEPWQFGRAAIVLSAYDEAREKGEKHSSAVTSAVEFVRRRSPGVPISEAGVKRILSMFRPRGSKTILRFERSPMSEKDILKHRWVREQFAKVQKEKGITSPERQDDDGTRPREKFMIRYSKRPDYPRYNRKTPRNNPLR